MSPANVFAMSAAIVWLTLLAYIASQVVGNNWGPLVNPEPGSCAELAQICARRGGRIWLDRDGSAECTVSREEKLP